MYITIIYASFQPESRHVQLNTIVLNGHSNNGVSIIGAAHSADFMTIDSPVRSTVRTLKLRNPALAASADGRMLVKYLVSCALPAGLTRCGFIAVGQCDSPAYVQDGIDYSAAVQVFLKAAELL